MEATMHNKECAQNSQKNLMGGWSSQLNCKNTGFVHGYHKNLKQVDILISKNQALQILYLKHHDNVYKTP